jgi:hypothetical protein
MKIKTIRKENVFIPEFQGNKDLPEEEQIKVNIKSFPTNGEAQEIRGFRMGKGESLEIVYADSVMLRRHIGGIKNITFDDASIPVINNGSTLASSKVLELAPLISEIREYLLETSEVLSEGEN